MNNDKDSLEHKLADAKALARGMLSKKRAAVNQENMVTVAKKRSPKDIVLWVLALVAFIGATLAGEYLPSYWIPATNRWTLLFVVLALVVFGLLCLTFTNQGRAFKVLLQDAGTELRRISWPSKNETTTYTWQVVIITIIAGILVWLLDNLFNHLVGLILG